MIKEGSIVLCYFPHTDVLKDKKRPVLVLKKIPNDFDDYLVCMITSQLKSSGKEITETIRTDDSDFKTSGLKTSSLIRMQRLFTTNKMRMTGVLGYISEKRFFRIQGSIAKWLLNTEIIYCGLEVSEETYLMLQRRVKKTGKTEQEIIHELIDLYEQNEKDITI